MKNYFRWFDPIRLLIFIIFDLSDLMFECRLKVTNGTKGGLIPGFGFQSRNN